MQLLRVLAPGSFSAGHTLTSGISYTRTGATSCLNAEGNLQLIDGGLPCVRVEGLVLEPTATQGINRTDNLLSSTYNAHNSTRFDAGNEVLAPDGTETALKVCGDGGSNPPGLYTNTFNSGALQNAMADAGRAFSWYVHAGPDGMNYFASEFGGNSQNVTWDLDAGTHYYRRSIQLSNLVTMEPLWLVDYHGNGWYRLTSVDSNVAGSSRIYMSRVAAVAAAQAAVDSNACAYVWGPSLTLGNMPSSYFPNSGTAAVVRGGVTAIITNPLADAGSPASWCVRETVTPDYRDWDYSTQVRGLMQAGTDAGIANSWGLYVTDAGIPVFSTYDAAGDEKKWTATQALWPGTRVVRACNASGTLSMQSSGPASTVRTLAGASTGTGTGVVAAQPSAVYLGSRGPNEQLLGRVMDACFSTGSTLCTIAGDALPSYPVAITNKTAIVYSDSLATDNALNGANSWPDVLEASLSVGWDVDNRSLPGKAISQFQQSWDQDAGVGVVTGRDVGARFLVLQPGPDETLFSYDAAWHARVQRDMMHDAASRGSEPLMVLGSPWKNSFSWTSGRQTFYASVQAKEAAWCAAYGYRCFDSYAAMGGGDAGTGTPDPAVLAVPFSYDLVHYSQAGADFVAASVKNILTDAGMP
jgi:hypothetical protein